MLFDGVAARDVSFVLSGISSGWDVLATRSSILFGTAVVAGVDPLGADFMLR